MKKAVWIALSVVLAGAAGFVVCKGMSGRTVAAQVEVSERSAATLRSKIDKVKKGGGAEAERLPETIEVSESELESYVMLVLTEDIPVKLDSIDVQLSEGTIAADAKLTSAPNGTGNAVVDVLLGGTHNLFVKGKLSAADGKGRFDLEEARVDGIPVPTILIETLIEKYVKPRYPNVDLREPFTAPWGIKRLTITEGKATIQH